MSRNRNWVLMAACAIGAGIVASSIVVAEDAPEEVPLPPGWTAEDMKACAEAGTPGEPHRLLARSVGTWLGKTKMWMAPGIPEAIEGECTQTISALFDGRYIQGELAGNFPGMGPFRGLGITGFDNVSGKYVGTWLDNQSTGMMHGVGELSKDGKTLTWAFTCNCPIRKAPASIRQVETYPDAETMTFEMFTTDPKSGKEFQCMRIDFKRKS